jgi:hypothetical protein
MRFESRAKTSKSQSDHHKPSSQRFCGRRQPGRGGASARANDKGTERTGSNDRTNSSAKRVVESALARGVSLFRLDSHAQLDTIIGRVDQVLLRSEISLGRLDARMAEQ